MCGVQHSGIGNQTFSVWNSACNIGPVCQISRFYHIDSQKLSCSNFCLYNCLQDKLSVVDNLCSFFGVEFCLVFRETKNVYITHTSGVCRCNEQLSMSTFSWYTVNSAPLGSEHVPCGFLVVACRVVAFYTL